MEDKNLEANNEPNEPMVGEVEELLEPTPYQNKYRKDLDKEETEDTATASKDTSSDEEATPDEERPVNAEEKVFKKRYDDLKRHYDSTVNKHKEEISKLQIQLETKDIIPPKTEQELETWKLKYPDVYDIIKSVAIKESQQTSKHVEDKLINLQKAQADLAKEKAEVELLKIHPDFRQIRETNDFHEWAQGQDTLIQSWLYENVDNPKLAARAIDLYKMDRKFPTLNKKSIEDNKKEAAKAITTTKKDSGKNVAEKKIWSVKEIAKMKPQEFIKFEKDIDLARREGRITN